MGLGTKCSIIQVAAQQLLKEFVTFQIRIRQAESLNHVIKETLAAVLVRSLPEIHDTVVTDFRVTVFDVCSGVFQTGRNGQDFQQYQIGRKIDFTWWPPLGQ